MAEVKEVEIKSVLGKRTNESIIKVHELLGQEKAEMGPLAMYVWLKRAQSLLEEAQVNLRQSANADFQELMKQQPDYNRWTVEQFATLTKNSLPATWIYPPELVAMEQQLKAKQEIAKNDGTASKKVPPLDPVTHALFKVTCSKV